MMIMEVISHHSVLFPVLRLCQAVLASLSSDNMSAASQIVHFLAGHEELTSIILRGSAASVITTRAGSDDLSGLQV